MYYAQKKKTPVAAVITMRIFFVKYFLSTEVVLAESQNCKKRAKAVSANRWPLATIYDIGTETLIFHCFATKIILSRAANG